jgi:hypothetical protein
MDVTVTANAFMYMPAVITYKVLQQIVKGCIYLLIQLTSPLLTNSTATLVPIYRKNVIENLIRSVCDAYTEYADR